MSGLPTLADHAFLFSFGAVERELVREFTARFAMLVVNVTGDVVMRALDGSNKVVTDASIRYMSYVTDTVRTRDTPFVLVVEYQREVQSDTTWMCEMLQYHVYVHVAHFKRQIETNGVVCGEQSISKIFSRFRNPFIPLDTEMQRLVASALPRLLRVKRRSMVPINVCTHVDTDAILAAVPGTDYGFKRNGAMVAQTTGGGQRMYRDITPGVYLYHRSTRPNLGETVRAHVLQYALRVTPPPAGEGEGGTLPVRCPLLVVAETTLPVWLRSVVRAGLDLDRDVCIGKVGSDILDTTKKLLVVTYNFIMIDQRNGQRRDDTVLTERQVTSLRRMHAMIGEVTATTPLCCMAFPVVVVGDIDSNMRTVGRNHYLVSRYLEFLTSASSPVVNVVSVVDGVTHMPTTCRLLNRELVAPFEYYSEVKTRDFFGGCFHQNVYERVFMIEDEEEKPPTGNIETVWTHMFEDEFAYFFANVFAATGNTSLKHVKRAIRESLFGVLNTPLNFDRPDDLMQLRLFPDEVVGSAWFPHPRSEHVETTLRKCSENEMRECSICACEEHVCINVPCGHTMCIICRLKTAQTINADVTCPFCRGPTNMYIFVSSDPDVHHWAMRRHYGSKIARLLYQVYELVCEGRNVVVLLNEEAKRSHSVMQIIDYELSSSAYVLHGTEHYYNLIAHDALQHHSIPFVFCVSGMRELNDMTPDVLEAYDHCVSMQSPAELSFRSQCPTKASTVLFRSKDGHESMLSHRFRHTFAIGVKETVDDPAVL